MLELDIRLEEDHEWLAEYLKKRAESEENNIEPVSWKPEPIHQRPSRPPEPKPLRIPLQEDLAAVSQDPSSAQYIQLLEKYSRPEERGTIVARAEKVLPPLDHIQVLVPLVSSDESASNRELFDKIHAIYERVPDSPEKLMSLNDTAEATRKHQPQFAATLLKQATQLCGSLAAEYARQGSRNEAREIINLMELVSSRVEARLKTVAYLGEHAASPALLADAMQEASLLTDDEDTQIRLFREIQSKALETHAFNDIDFTARFISEYVKLPGMETRELGEVYRATPASIEKLNKLFNTVIAIENRADARDLLLRAIKSEALETYAFNDIDFAARFISEITRLPDVEPMPEVESVLRSIEGPSAQVEILFAAIPKVGQDLAYHLAQRSFELTRDASPSVEARRQSLKKLFSLAQSQRLLADKTFCEDLTLGLVEVAEFQDAKRALTANGALYQDVALRTSGKTPGFALDALNHALESNKDLTYSEQHAQILANITQQIAKYSPERAKRVCGQSVEMAKHLVPDSAVKHQKHRFYERISSPSNPRITDPAHIRFGEGDSQPIAVRIVLEADFQTFVETKEQMFIEGLADMLRVSPDDVLILNRSEGSIAYKLYFELQEVSYILKQKFETQDEDIQRLQSIIDAVIKLVELIIATMSQVTEAAARKPAVPEGKIVEIELEERIPKEMVTVRIKLPDGTEDNGDVNLPFDEEKLTTVLKILEKRSLDDSRIWRPSQIETLYRLGLIDKPGIVPDIFPRVMTHFGQVLTRRKPGRFSQILEGHRWLTILMALAFRLGLKRESWEPYQIGILYEMGLINRISLIPTHLQKVGNMIYDQDGKGLTSNRKIYHRLQSSIEQSADENIAWQLKIDKVNTHLTRYPWELIRNEN